jgi:hypothetical protein
VDLAGSERVAKSEVQGDRLKEAQSINRSLASLGDVIAALSRNMAANAHGPSSQGHGQPGNGHVPFRDSKLSYLLKSSLSGTGRVAMLCTVSPAAGDIDETVRDERRAAHI